MKLLRIDNPRDVTPIGCRLLELSGLGRGEHFKLVFWVLCAIYLVFSIIPRLFVEIEDSVHLLRQGSELVFVAYLSLQNIALYFRRSPFYRLVDMLKHCTEKPLAENIEEFFIRSNIKINQSSIGYTRFFLFVYVLYCTITPIASCMVYFRNLRNETAEPEEFIISTEMKYAYSACSISFEDDVIDFAAIRTTKLMFEMTAMQIRELRGPITQEQLNSAEDLLMALQQLHWYDQPIVIQRQILLMIRCSQVPIVLKAGKLFAANVVQFSEIVQNFPQAMKFLQIDDPSEVLPIGARLLKLFGLPRDDSYKRIFWFQCVFFMLFGMIPRFLNKIYEPIALVRIGAEIVYATYLLVQMISLYARRGDLYQLIDMLRECVGNPCPDSVHAFILSSNDKINKLAVTCSKYFMVVCISYIGMPTIATSVVIVRNLRNQSGVQEEYVLPTEMNFFYLDIRFNLLHYSFYLGAVSVLGIIGSLMLCTKDVVDFSLIRTTSMLFQVAAMRIRELPPWASQDKLKVIIHTHRSALACAAKLQQALDSALLIQLTFCTAIWCIMLFYILLLADEVLGALQQLAWYNQTVSVQKELYFMIQRSQKRIELKAGKLFPVNIAQFSEILFSLIGVYGKPADRFRQYAGYFYLWFALFIPKLILGYDTIPQCFRSIAEGMFGFNTFITMFLLPIKMEQLESLLQDLKRFTEKVASDVEYRQILITLNMGIHRFTKYYCIFTNFIVFAMSCSTSAGVFYTYFTQPANRSVAFPLLMENNLYMLDAHYNIGHCFLHQAIILPSLYILLVGFTAKAGTFFGLIRYCSTVMQILALKIDRLCLLDSVEQYTAELREIIELHQLAIKCARQLQRILMDILLAQFTGCVLIWCFLLYSLMISGITAEGITVIAMLVAFSQETFLFCLLGSELTMKTPNNAPTMRFFLIAKPPGVPHIALKLLRLVGVSPVKTVRFRYVPMFVVFLLTIAIPKAVFGYPNFETSIIGLAELFFQTNRFVGVLMLVLYSDTLDELVRASEAFTSKILTEASPVSQYLTKTDAQITKITRLYLTALLVPANFYSYSPIVSTVWKYYNAHENDTAPVFILHMEENFYGLNIRQELTHYLIFGAIMVPTSFLCALVGTAKLVSILSLIKYCTVYFRVVTVKLEAMVADGGQVNAAELRSVIKMHQSALGCADLLKTITAPIMLLQLLLCILVWSSMLLYFTVAGFNTQFISVFILFLFDTTETFGYCYLGTQLSDESAHIANIVYDCRWESLPPVVQKDLQLALMRAQRPVAITAGKFCFMNMEQFGEVSGIINAIFFEGSIVGLAELFFHLNNFTGLLLILVRNQELQCLIRAGQNIADEALLLGMNFLRKEQPAGVPHIPIKLLKAFGITGGPAKRFRILPIMLTYLFILVVPKCFFGYPNFELAIIGIAELFFQTNSFCGIFILFLNRHKLDLLISHAKSFSLTVLREAPPAVVQHLTAQHEMIHNITRMFCIVVMCAAHFYVFAPFLATLYTFYATVRHGNETMHYTLHMEENFYGLTTRTSAPHYLIFGIVMTPTAYLCAFTGTVKTLTICNITIYCTLYFQLVQVRLRAVTRGNTIGRELKSIVKMHQEALHCASLLESITSVVLLQQLLLCVLIWSSMLLYFTVSGFNVNFMNLFVLFVFDTTESFAYCYLGEQLSNESARVAHTVYESSWETQTTTIQKDLQLVLVRAQSPVGVTAAKFCYMNMEQFGIIVKTTYSFFVVLRDQF
uniref:Uncharacterized protein n=1 Tax=Anopheles christyi TaxID=43041 RepID=A0A182JSN9_9DIPT